MLSVSEGLLFAVYLLVYRAVYVDIGENAESENIACNETDDANKSNHYRNKICRETIWISKCQHAPEVVTIGHKQDG